MGKLFIAFTILLFSLLVFAYPKPILARSGCCSWHGGVCGCGCCDGTPLSSTCAPYYPSCSKPVYIVPTSTPTPIPTATTTRTPTNTPTPTPTITPTMEPVNTQVQETQVLGVTDSKEDTQGLFYIASASVGVVAYILKKIKDHSK